MTLKELQSQVSYLGFETEITDTEAFTLAANRALRQIFLDYPSPVTARIQTPKPRLLTAYKTLRHRGGEREIIPLAGRALTFRVSGTGRYRITDGDEVYETPFSGKGILVRTLLDKGGELELLGDYDYTVYGLATYSAPLGNDRGDIPEYKEYREYELGLYLRDFSSAATAPKDPEGRHIRGARIEGDTLFIPFDYDGEAVFTYRRTPTPVEYGYANSVIDIPEQISHTLPLLTASFLWLDDDDQKAVHYLTLYREAMATARRYTSAASDSSYLTNGWA